MLLRWSDVAVLLCCCADHSTMLPAVHDTSVKVTISFFKTDDADLQNIVLLMAGLPKAQWALRHMLKQLMLNDERL